MGFGPPAPSRARHGCSLGTHIPTPQPLGASLHMESKCHHTWTHQDNQSSCSRKGKHNMCWKTSFSSYIPPKVPCGLRNPLHEMLLGILHTVSPQRGKLLCCRQPLFLMYCEQQLHVNAFGSSDGRKEPKTLRKTRSLCLVTQHE